MSPICACFAGLSACQINLGLEPRAVPLNSAATGSVAPSQMGGHRKPVLAPHRAFIMERLGQTPHLTLHAPNDELAPRGVKVNAVWLTIHPRGHSPSNRPA
jgi:transposase